jgi:uncharacterized protein YxjI
MKKFIVEQKLAPLANQYRVYNDDKTSLLAFAHQKRFTMKEKVEFYGDEAKSSIVFTVTAEKVMDIHGRFFIRDENGGQLGTLRKPFKSSLLRSTYELFDAQENFVAIVQERSQVIAVLRRVWGFIPFVGELPFVFKYHFDFVNPQTHQVIARYNKTTSFRDHYELLVNDETLIDKVGWQTLVAQAVMLDVMQGR